jgi:DNA repair exonuclease SbcCD ATPase subunit
MSLPIDVRSIDVLTDFRAVLCRSGEDAKNALAAAEMEINRMVEWLSNDRRLHWQAEIQRQRNEVARAKSELFRKQTSRMYGNDASFSEQRDMLREAKERLEFAEKKLERVRHWVQPLQQAIMEYRASARPLADMIDSDVARALSLLERMARALEQYANDPLPTTAYVQSLRRDLTAKPVAATPLNNPSTPHQAGEVNASTPANASETTAQPDEESTVDQPAKESLKG